MHHQCTASSQK